MGTPINNLSQDTTVSELLSRADQCVKCGLCLSSCPTYGIFSNEADSPRGRITLMQSLLKNQLPASDSKLFDHLDGCLGCGNCEKACPSGVKFIDLLDDTKALFNLSQLSRSQLSLLSSPSWLNSLNKVSVFMPRSLSFLLPKLFAKSLKYSIKTRENIIQTFPSPVNSTGRIGIFTGCVGKMIDASAINLTCTLLNKLGFEIVIPEKQGCCGAMHQHEGYKTEAQSLLNDNISIFNTENIDAVLYFASGCGARLLQQGSALFNAPLMEATDFLSKLDLPFDLKSINQKVAIHSPCTLRNQTNAWPGMLALVKKIAGDQLVELPDNTTCCGSAGLHMLKYPAAANQLVQPKIDALMHLQPDVLLTANTGCALHFKQALNEAGLTVRVMHPAEWVAEKLSDISLI